MGEESWMEAEEGIHLALLEPDCGLVSSDEMNKLLPTKYRQTEVGNALDEHFSQQHAAKKAQVEEKIGAYIAEVKLQAQGSSLGEASKLLQNRRRKAEAALVREQTQAAQLEAQLERVVSILGTAAKSKQLPSQSFKSS